MVKAGLELDNYSFYKDIVYKGAQSVTDIIVIKHLYLFKDKVLEAANKYEPFIISRYLIGLAKVFNKFYEDNKILVHDPHRRAFRLSIVYAVKHVLAEGLYLLGLKSLAKM